VSTMRFLRLIESEGGQLWTSLVRRLPGEKYQRDIQPTVSFSVDTIRRPKTLPI
jgi:hypothetical protein